MKSRAFEQAAASSETASFYNEPHWDFSKRNIREAFARDLKEVTSDFPIEAPLWIGGEPVDGGESIEIRSPNDTTMRVGGSASAAASDVERAIRSAQRAFGEWAAASVEDRVALMRQVAETVRRERRNLAALEVHEAGKPWREADADVCEAIDFIEYYAQEAMRLGTPQVMQPDLLGERNELMYSPLGVAGVIGPWNFPLAIPTGMMAAAVVSGNTVVWKPAEQTPLVIWRMMGILRQCGLPDGVVNYLPGYGEAGKALVESPEVQMIAFTGSRDVGAQIIESAGTVRPGQRFVKRVVTEMGGKNAIIFDSSADLDHALPDILYSVYGYSGQKCSACSRLIVVQSVYDALLERLKEGIASLKIAPATDPGCEVGPLIDSEARAKSEAYLELAHQEGREICVGDVGAWREQGHFVAPAAFEVRDPRCRIAQEEIFGPVLAVMEATDFDHALELANDTDYGLTGGVFSRTPSHLSKARTAYQCGNLYFNRGITGSIVGRQPFGGFKMSGIGSKTGGPDYLKQFLVSRTITDNLMRQGTAPLDAEES